MPSIAFLGMFIENISKGKVTIISKIYLGLTIASNLSMHPASSEQFMYNIQVLYVPFLCAYLLYLLLYNILYF
jgi:hypothetical protein